jgi:hypothetical protein
LAPKQERHGSLASRAIASSRAGSRLKAAGSTSWHSGVGTLVLIALKARNGLAIGRDLDPMALTQRFDAVFLAPVH